MNIQEQLRELDEHEFEKLIKKLDAKTIVFCALAMDDDLIDRVRYAVPIPMIDKTNKEMMKLKNVDYTRDEVIENIKEAGEILRKTYHEFRMELLFKEKKRRG
jgi:hypothetical protein